MLSRNLVCCARNSLSGRVSSSQPTGSITEDGGIAQPRRSGSDIHDFIANVKNTTKYENVGPRARARELIVPDRLLTAEDIRNAALTFPQATGVGADNTSPRAIAALPTAMRSRLADLLNQCERDGVWPSRWQLVVIALIPKSDGGRRPIGLFPATIRVWMRARSAALRHWEAENDHCSFLPHDEHSAGACFSATRYRSIIMPTSTQMKLCKKSLASSSIGYGRGFPREGTPCFRRSLLGRRRRPRKVRVDLRREERAMTGVGAGSHG